MWCKNCINTVNFRPLPLPGAVLHVAQWRQYCSDESWSFNRITLKNSKNFTWCHYRRQSTAASGQTCLNFKLCLCFLK